MKKVAKKKIAVLKKVPKHTPKLSIIAVKPPEIPQGASYWINRLQDDKQRDWFYGAENWLEDYVESVNHPHRQMILDILATLDPFSSLLEIGCSVGPNLQKINARFPHANLFGIDLNKDAVDRAQTSVVREGIEVRLGAASMIPYDTKSMDVVLADASLMYAGPGEIGRIMEDIDRVAKRSVLIVDRYNESREGKVTGHVWGRNYTQLLTEKGFLAYEIKMTKKLWPESVNWQKYGRFFIGTK